MPGLSPVPAPSETLRRHYTITWMYILPRSTSLSEILVDNLGAKKKKNDHLFQNFPKNPLKIGKILPKKGNFFPKFLILAE